MMIAWMFPCFPWAMGCTLRVNDKTAISGQRATTGGRPYKSQNYIIVGAVPLCPPVAINPTSPHH